MSAEAKIVTSDFYDLEALLDDDDRALLHRVRAFMDEQVEPIINEYWTRGQVPAGPDPRARRARHRRHPVLRLRLPRPVAAAPTA